MRRSLFAAACALLALGTTASAYYHYTRFTTRSGPYQPVRMKFDLNALPNRTVQFFVNDQGPSKLAQGDSFAAVVSELRLAAKIWNDVETSDLRLAFGGVVPSGVPQSSAGIDVVFDDLPPGVLALGGPNTRGDLAVGANGEVFAPISRSVLRLGRDLSSRPSYSEGFFLTLVHEFGHSLGLQHTLTSSAMSTETTRGTFKAQPLGPDDIAGLSLLYPTPAFTTNYASITGRVTMDGNGANLASVVALLPNGGAVSTLTNPDGTYRLQGLPPGQYLLYVHPLPPRQGIEETPANLYLPRDVNQQPIGASGAFELQFYPGTKEVQTAQTIGISAGQTIDNLNFSVIRRSRAGISAVSTYGYFGDNAVKPPFLLAGGTSNFIVAAGTNLMTGGQPVNGLRVGVVGNAASIVPNSLRAYTNDYLLLSLQVSPFASVGPRHLVFSADNDNYLLPNGIQLVQRQPPAINSIGPAVDASNRGLQITGTNLVNGTRILFDGVPATVRSVDEANSRMVVVAPPADGGTHATVVALNPDGQSSLLLQSQNPPVYSFDPAPPTGLSVSPNTLPPGVEAVLDIAGINTNFADGQTTVSLGSSDVAIRRVFVLSPTRLLVNVVTAPNASTAYTTIAVTSGLQTTVQTFGFALQPATSRLVQISSQVTNALNGQLGLQAGAPGTVTVLGAAATPAVSNTNVTLNGRSLPVVAVSGAVVQFQVPADVSLGPGLLRVQVGGDQSLAVAVSVDAPAPVVLTALGVNGFIDAARPARPGDVLNLTVSGMGDAPVGLNRIAVSIGGVDCPVYLNVMSGQPGLQIVQIVIPASVTATGSATLTLSLDGRPSLPYVLPLRSS